MQLEPIEMAKAFLFKTTDINDRNPYICKVRKDASLSEVLEEMASIHSPLKSKIFWNV